MILELSSNILTPPSPPSPPPPPLPHKHTHNTQTQEHTCTLFKFPKWLYCKAVKEIRENRCFNDDVCKNCCLNGSVVLNQTALCVSLILVGDQPCLCPPTFFFQIRKKMQASTELEQMIWKPEMRRSTRN